MQDVVPIRTALLSVSDKQDLVPFARLLADRGVRLISTGGTKRALADAGLAVVGVSEITGFPEMMDGRVKTLHPKIHGGLLALRDEPGHAASLQAHGITPIDLVCVNLYPFERTVADPNVATADAIEQIDIGGPSMVRSAAKNHRYVTIVTDPDQYPSVGQALDQHDGGVPRDLRESLAAAAFARTAEYDTAISRWLGERFA
jgi:phosphoribosylaminoimidazolecarboxamide formyltransferase/IMP cyclohydrolase